MNKVISEPVLAPTPDKKPRFYDGKIVYLEGVFFRVIKIKPKDIHLRRLNRREVDMVRKSIKDAS